MDPIYPLIVDLYLYGLYIVYRLTSKPTCMSVRSRFLARPAGCLSSVTSAGQAMCILFTAAVSPTSFHLFPAVLVINSRTFAYS